MSVIVPDPATTDWVPLWSLGGPGSLVYIDEQTLAASAASIDFQNIPATYKHLVLMGDLRGDTAAATVNVWVRLNGDSGANYDYEALAVDGASVSRYAADAAAQFLVGNAMASTGRANRFSGLRIEVPDYANTTREKSLLSHSVSIQPGGARSMNSFGGQWRSTVAINRLTFLPSVGNFVAGSRLTLYALTDWYPATQPVTPAMGLIAEQVLAADGLIDMALPDLSAYRSIDLRGSLREASASAGAALQVRFNNDSGANYASWAGGSRNAAASANQGGTAGTFMVGGISFGNSANASEFSNWFAQIMHPGLTDRKKNMTYQMGMYGSPASYAAWETGGGVWNSTAAITRIAFTNTFKAGSRLAIYGIA